MVHFTKIKVDGHWITWVVHLSTIQHAYFNKSAPADVLESPTLADIQKVGQICGKHVVEKSEKKLAKQIGEKNDKQNLGTFFGKKYL